MEHKALEYMKSRVVSAEPTISGDVITHTKVTLDSGEVVEGCAVRDINSYEKSEADAAAFMDAIKAFIPGVEIILNKPA